MNVRKQPKTAYPTILNWGFPSIFIFFALYMTLGQNLDFLKKLQELDLFLFRDYFFFDSLQRVGGFSMYLSAFLNQFFYIPLVGSILLLILLLLISWLNAKAFNLKEQYFPLCFIPSLALLLSLTELGYMIFYQKIDGYVYNNILGIICILTGLMAFKRMNRQSIKVIFVVAYLLIAYPLFGVYPLAGGFLMLLASTRDYFESKQRAKLLLPVILSSLIPLIPFLYYKLVYDQMAFSTIYTAVLPNFKINSAETILWLPYLTMFVFLIFMVLWRQKEQQTKKLSWSKIVPGFIFVTSMAVVYLFSFKDENFNRELSMQTAIENEDWNDVLKNARKQHDEPTRLIVLNTNLALYKLGLAGDKMFHYKNGNKPTKSPRFILPVQLAGTGLYYQYGLINYCNKWCMEEMVEYGLSNSVLKYFVLSSLLNGDIALAKKFNAILLSTLFYKDWALKHQRYIDHPETITQASEFKNILSLKEYDDVLDGDYGNMEAFLKNHFSHLRAVPPALTELSVLFSLETKNIERFWPRLFRWVGFNKTKKIPIHFQEAALLYEHLEHKVDLTGAPFEESVKSNFRNYMAMVQQYGQYPEESLKQISYNQFGNTFWHYYFFVKDSKSQKKEDKEYIN